MPESPRLVVYHSENWDNPVLTLRVRAPAAAAGWAVTEGNQWEAGRLLACAPEAVDQADRVLIQREFPRFTAACDAVLARAQAAGRPVIYELDDLLLELPRDHPGWRYHARSRLAILRAAAEADAVVVSTEPLAEVFRPLNPVVHVWPNCWDEALWPLRPPAAAPDEPVVLGYVGTHTHAADVAPLGPVLARLLARHAGRLVIRFIGGTPPPAEVRDRPGVEWQPAQRLDYADYARAMQAERLDIAVAPLRDDAFNRCKSAIKYLEYSALGAAGVYSRLPPYAAVVRPGETGWLAAEPEEWEAALEGLILAPERRRQMAAAAQADVRARWRLADQAARWAAALAAVPARQPPHRAQALRLAERWAAEVAQDLDEQLAEARQAAAAAPAGPLTRLRRWLRI